jgi:nicotinate dehydrogenase subunit A
MTKGGDAAVAQHLVIQVNGARHSVQATPDTPLLYILRNELRLHGPRFGCGLAQCGACTVLLGDDAIRSCVTPVASVTDRPVTTLEGLGTQAKPHPLQTAFVKTQAAQCGYCISGMIMQAAAFLKAAPNPSEAEIKQVMNKNLCRCGTHYRIVAAIQRAAKVMAA